MKINVHAEEEIISLFLSPHKCASTSWGNLCQHVVEKSLTTVYPQLILQILTKLSPKERFLDYLIRYGDGNATIIRVEWSSVDIPGFDRVPLVSGYIKLNMTLKPRGGGGALDHVVKPHLSVRQLGLNDPESVEVDLCISLVSFNPSSAIVYPTTQEPFPYNDDHTSVLYLREHERFPGRVGSFRTLPADGRNNLLPGTARMPQPEASAAEPSSTAGRKRKTQSSKAGIEPSKSKSTNSKKKKDTSKPDGDGAKKTVAKDGNGGAAAAAAKEISTPEESAPSGLNTPLRKSGIDMIGSSKNISTTAYPKTSSSKNDKTSQKKDKGKSNAAGSTKHSSAPGAKMDSGEIRVPSAENGYEMIRRYQDWKATSGGDVETPSKERDAAKSSSSKTTKGSSKKDKKKSSEGGDGNEASVTEKGKSSKKKSSKESYEAAAKASMKEGKAHPEDESSDILKSPSKKKTKTSTMDSGEIRVPSAENGNEMIRRYQDWKATSGGDVETPSKERDAAKSSSSKTTKGSSKKDKTKSGEGSDTDEAATEEEKASKKKSSKESYVAVATASMKKRKAHPEDESSDILKSPSKKKTKTSNVVKSTPAKVAVDEEGEKSATTMNVESTKKKTSALKTAPCGKCEGCMKNPCHKCAACTANPKKRCELRPCSSPKKVDRAEYEARKAKKEAAVVAKSKRKEDSSKFPTLEKDEKKEQRKKTKKEVAELVI